SLALHGDSNRVMSCRLRRAARQLSIRLSIASWLSSLVAERIRSNSALAPSTRGPCSGWRLSALVLRWMSTAAGWTWMQPNLESLARAYKFGGSRRLNAKCILHLSFCIQLRPWPSILHDERRLGFNWGVGSAHVGHGPEVARQ